MQVNFEARCICACDKTKDQLVSRKSQLTKAGLHVLVLLDQRRAAGVDEPAPLAPLTPGPGHGGGHDRVELVAAPEPELDGVAHFKLVAVDVEPGKTKLV